MDIHNKIIELVKELNVIEKKRLKDNDYTNLAFFTQEGMLTDSYKVTSKEKKKYFYIDMGNSGAFMIDKTDNQVYNIKGYGVINRKKCYGSVFDLDGVRLHGLRWDPRR